MPQIEKPDDPHFNRPLLGAHYTQVWAGEDGEYKRSLSNLSNTRQSTRIAATKPSGVASPGGPEEEEDDLVIGDLTQRILCALIEENLVISHPPSPDNEMASSESPSNNPENGDLVPAIPTSTYSKQAMLSLEDRIRLELRSIGLLDDMEGIDPSEKEDDEVCAEIRNLQNLLRERMAANNERKAKMLEMVRARMHEQDIQKKQKQANSITEKSYQKYLQRKRKRGGRRPTPLPVPLPESST